MTAAIALSSRLSSFAPRLSLAVLLFTLYLISGSGGFHIIDEVSLYSVTENLARRGAWDTDQIAWSQWVNSPAEVLGAWGADGHVYSKKGVAPALLFLPLRLIAGLIPGAGLLQTTLLSNALITIATAWLLWAIARRLGYSERLGGAAALIYGVATLAWPYATHLFGEPLSALCLAVALWAILAWRQDGGWKPCLLLGLGLAVAAGASAVYALLLPLFALAWWQARPAGRGRLTGADLKAGLALILPLVLTAAFLLWYNALRFGNPLDTGYHFEAGEGFNGSLLAGLYGLLASPYRGILYHQPLTLLALAGLPFFLRRHRFPGILTAVSSLLLLFVFAKWWIWWGGFAWGPRFLVPLAPFLVLWTLPLLESGSRWLVGALVALSALVQSLAVSANYVLWEIELRGLYPTDWSDPLRYGAPAAANPLHSPVFGQIYLLARRQWDAVLDFGWWQSNGIHAWIPLLGLFIILLAGGSFLGRLPRRLPHLVVPLFLLAGLLPFTLFSLRAYAASDRYGQPGGYPAILRQIEADENGNAAIVTVAPYHYQIPMNRYDGDLPILGFAQEAPLRPQTARLLSLTLADHGSIYLITSGLSPAAPGNGVEQWLDQHAYLATDQWYDDFRLLRYGAANPALPLDAGQVWGSPPVLTLVNARVSTTTPDAGSVLSLDLTWKPFLRPGDLHLFIQLLPAAGAPVAQFDRAFPTAVWQPEVIYSTPAGLWLPPGTSPGDYRLIAGWYDPAGGRRLSLGDEGDFAPLAFVTVRSPD